MAKLNQVIVVEKGVKNRSLQDVTAAPPRCRRSGAGEQDAQAARLQVGGGGVLAAGQRVPDEGDVELAALEAVGGVHGDAGQAADGEAGADRVRLDGACRADRNVRRGQNLPVDQRAALQQPGRRRREGVRRLRGLVEGVAGGEFQVAPAGVGGLGEDAVQGPEPWGGLAYDSTRSGAVVPG